ncbi:transporter substrate-binding domain-containing protein [Pseudodesulfovibrio indicus]|uniref:substrate-binding periplasmic protein n=1 Tax=Pseudodesulfovibrio indicus TaxID=1716143 RepID=UPI00292DD625|nr:transporter substrate-binding domain-containing protein [Pseudodesulfovibrio indicus]
MPLRKTLLAVVAFLLLASSVQAAPAADDWTAPPVCVFGMPVMGAQLRTSKQGVFTDVLKAVFEPEGYDLVHRELPYARAKAEVAQCKIQCTLAIRDNVEGVTSAHAAIALYSPAVGYVLANGFHGVEDLAGQKVAHLFGSDIQRLLPVEIRPQPTYDLSSAVLMLDRGHVKYVVTDGTVLRETIAACGLPEVEFGIVPLMTLEVVPVFSPDEAGRHLCAIYDRRMRELASSGRLEAIYRSYGFPETFIREVLKGNGR